MPADMGEKARIITASEKLFYYLIKSLTEQGQEGERYRYNWQLTPSSSLKRNRRKTEMGREPLIIIIRDY